MGSRSDFALRPFHPSRLQRVILVELFAEDGELALERLDHRLVDAWIDIGAGFASTRQPRSTARTSPLPTS